MSAEENKGRKSQAALEFIMTYGWVILVVLAAVGAFAYSGFLSPCNFFRRENKQMDCGTIKQNNSANRHTKQYFALHNLFSHAVGRD